MTVHHCLFLRPHDRLDSWRNFWDLKLENEGGNLFSWTLPSMGDWSHSCCDVGNCQYLLFLSAGVLIISFGYCKRESSSLFSVVFMVVAEEIYTYVACDSGEMWAYMFAVCCFSCTMIRKLFLIWLSLNQMFVTWFSVSFDAGQVERTTHMSCLIRDCSLFMPKRGPVFRVGG